MNALKRCKLLTYHLLTSSGAAPPVHTGKEITRFTRWYLAAIAAGFRPYQERDLFLVDLLLEEWDKKEERGCS